MVDQADATSTPAAQQQHNPPSLPTSPHPKRVKTDELLNNTTASLPNMSDPRSGADNASTPTPSNPPQYQNQHSLPNLSSIPSVSSLLSSNSAAMPMPMPPMLPNGSMNIPMHMPPLGAPMPMPMQMPIPMPGQQPIVPLPTAAPPLLVKKLVPEATTPTRGSAFAAGYDLYASAPLTLKAKSKGLISTGLAIATPPGTYGRVAPRSGLASKHFLDTGAGVIDADYRGEVKVLMFNFSDVDYEVKQGERVAQLVLERIVTPDVLEVQELEESVRGAGGFGSTGYI